MRELTRCAAPAESRRQPGLAAPLQVLTGVSTSRFDRRDCLQWLRSAVGGLFLELNCPRMVLAVKGSFAMTNRIMPLTAPGHSLMTADREEEKASLVGRHLCTSRFKVLAIRSNDLSAIWLSAQELSISRGVYLGGG